MEFSFSKGDKSKDSAIIRRTTIRSGNIPVITNDTFKSEKSHRKLLHALFDYADRENNNKLD